MFLEHIFVKDFSDFINLSYGNIGHVSSVEFSSRVRGGCQSAGEAQEVSLSQGDEQRSNSE